MEVQMLRRQAAMSHYSASESCQHSKWSQTYRDILSWPECEMSTMSELVSMNGLLPQCRFCSGRLGIFQR